MCVLLGYGADAICPYLVFEMAKSLREEGVLDESFTDKVVFEVSKRESDLKNLFENVRCNLCSWLFCRTMPKPWIKAFQK